MMSISINEVGGKVANLTAASNRLSRLLPSSSKRVQPTVEAPKGTASAANVPSALEPKSASLVPGELELKTAFKSALVANSETWTSLSKATQAAIEAGYGRDEVIAWGLETKLSESHVRSTVSRLFIELVGRVKSTGGGRKRTPFAQRVAKMILRLVKGDYAKAKSVLLAARRVLEAMEKQANKD